MTAGNRGKGVANENRVKGVVSAARVASALNRWVNGHRAVNARISVRDVITANRGVIARSVASARNARAASVLRPRKRYARQQLLRPQAKP